MLLERAIEGRFRFITDLRGHLREAGAGILKMSRRQLHAPATEIVHRRDADKMCEAIGKHRSRQANLVGEGIEGPLTRWLAMNQRIACPTWRSLSPESQLAEPSGKAAMYLRTTSTNINSASLASIVSLPAPPISASSAATRNRLANQLCPAADIWA